MKKIVTIVGARPQFVKASVLRKLFDKSSDFTEVLVHTGQHYDTSMSDIFFEELSINPPEHHLSINGGGHGEMTGEMLASIEKILIAEKPDACLIYGDTNSTLAGALAAAKMHIPVIHVEAGLRSFNKAMPEEVNRILTDHISDQLYCSTYMSLENLKDENITDGVYHVGDIMYDATLDAIARAEGITEVKGVSLKADNIAACTLHRAENTDSEPRLRAIIDYLNAQCNEYDIILPLHPRTRNALAKYNMDVGRIKTIDPVGYMEMQALLAAAKIVFTDSGGLQKEAYFHGTPCVTLRDETEWVELIDHGWNKLWTEADFKPRKAITEYGDGKSGEKILAHMLEDLG